MLQDGKETILVMEDDIKFAEYFTKGLSAIIKEATRHTPSWDFM